MKPVYSLKSASSLDRSLISAYALSESSLIDGAANGAYRIIKKRVLNKKVLFVIGKGNNGSDGLELARILSKESNRISILYLSDDGNDENLKRREKVSFLPRAFEVSGYDVIVDCIFGFGFKGELDGIYRDIINEINSSGSYIISLDVPSAGKIIANETVVFMANKVELLEPLSRVNSGILHLVNPGFPENELVSSNDNIYLLDDEDLDIQPFRLSDYKNTRGHIAVIGGSRKYPGAPVLSIQGAIKSGVGLATLISKKEVLSLVYSSYPSILLQEEDDIDFDKYSAIVVGPGWDSGSEPLLQRAIESQKPLVIDADGIKLLKDKHLGWNGVITPHLGEYRKLCEEFGIDTGFGDAEKLLASISYVARRLECIVVLKGSVLWISDGDKLFIYDGHNPSLGVAGSGDILSGIIGALLSSGETPLKGAVNGVILHQIAGRKAHEKYGYYMAEKLIEEIERP